MQQDKWGHGHHETSDVRLHCKAWLPPIAHKVGAFCIGHVGSAIGGERVMPAKPIDAIGVVADVERSQMFQVL